MVQAAVVMVAFELERVEEVEEEVLQEGHKEEAGWAGEGV